MLFHFNYFYAFLVILISNHTFYCSIALVVDNPEFFNRIAESFLPRADIHVIVLLWGEKSFLKESYSPNYERNIPIYEYKEVIVLGKKSREALISSDSKGIVAINFSKVK